MNAYTIMYINGIVNFKYMKKYLEAKESDYRHIFLTFIYCVFCESWIYFV